MRHNGVRRSRRQQAAIDLLQLIVLGFVGAMFSFLLTAVILETLIRG